MLGRLIPRDDQFFELFDQLAAHLATSAQMLETLFGDTEHASQHVRAIKDIEHKADLLTATVNQRIDATSVCIVVRCVCMQPLGSPVVPDVYGMTQRSSGPTVCGPASSPAAHASRARLRRDSLWRVPG